MFKSYLLLTTSCLLCLSLAQASSIKEAEEQSHQCSTPIVQPIVATGAESLDKEPSQKSPCTHSSPQDERTESPTSTALSSSDQQGQENHLKNLRLSQPHLYSPNGNFNAQQATSDLKSNKITKYNELIELFSEAKQGTALPEFQEALYHFASKKAQTIANLPNAIRSASLKAEADILQKSAENLLGQACTQQKTWALMIRAEQLEQENKIEEATNLYTKALTQGDLQAKEKMVEIHSLGIKNNQAWAQHNQALILRQLKKDKEAISFFIEAVNQGHADAQYELGMCYFTGDGHKKDLKKAVTWLRKAADQGDATAQCNLGTLYNEQNKKEEAFKWLQKAADQGHATAQCNLGKLYAEQNNEEEAFAWIQKAADQGLADAQYNLALFYDQGNGCEKDLNKSFAWFQKAANQGHAKAQFNLALCYSAGNGCKKDPKKAFE